MFVRFLSLVGLWMLLALTAAPASAQQWLSDRARSEGRGIQLGPLQLHPGIGAEVGWDSNVFLAEHDPVDNTEASAILRVAPHIDVSTPDEGGKVRFRGGANASLRHYFATQADTTLGVGETFNLTLQPVPVFAWQFLQSLNRTSIPFTDAPGLPSADLLDFGRTQLGVGTRVQVSTTSQLLRGGVGYRIDFDIFDASEYDANDTTTHTISADSNWIFLPKTALFWNGTVKLRGYDEPSALGFGERNDSTETSSRVGLNGALTDRIGFTLGVGYGAGFFVDNGDYENVVTQVETRWKVSDNVNWTLGYERTTSPSYFGNSIDSDRIATSLSAMFGGVFVLALRADFAFLDFGVDDDLVAIEIEQAMDMGMTLTQASAPSADRDDKHLTTNLSGEYRFTEWLALTGEVGYSQNFTTYVYPASAGTTADDPAKWRRFEAWLGMRAFL